MEKYWLFYLLAFLSEILGTVSGFGSSILFVPIASIFFDFKVVLSITAIFHIFSNLSKLILFRKGFDKNIIIKLGIPAIIAVIAGAQLSAFIPQKEIEIGMSVALVILSVYLLFNFDKSLSQTNFNLIFGGSVSGFLAGIIGTGGAIRGLVLSAFNIEKSIFVATSAAIDLGIDFSRAVVYVLNGFFNKDFIETIPVLIGISWLGSWIGKKILHKASQKTFRYLVVVTIIATAIFQIVKFFHVK
jgi:uncharacterized membrane protein YfcA